MFKTLEITNFKSIGHAVFDLGSINVLTGHSNLGKSNVVNAIYCLAHNHWDSNYLKWGEKKCSVKLTDDTGAWVEYSHGKDSSAEYRLSTVETPFTKIGKTVPEPVKQFLNMNLVQFDEDLSLDFNFERQFDPSFIISLSGFELAKVFGKMMNLDIVLSAARSINKDLMALNKDIEAQKAIEQVSIDYIQKAYVIELKYALLHTASQLDEQADVLDQKNNQLLGYLTDLKLYKEKIKLYYDFLNSSEMSAIDQIEEPVSGLDTILTNFYVAKQSQSVLQENLATEIPEFDFEANKSIFECILQKAQVDTQKLVYSEFIHNSEIDFDLESVVDLKSLIDSRAQWRVEKDYQESKLKNATELVTIKQDEFTKFLETNRICPYSNQPLPDSCISSIVNSV